MAAPNIMRQTHQSVIASQKGCSSTKARLCLLEKDFAVTGFTKVASGKFSIMGLFCTSHHIPIFMLREETHIRPSMCSLPRHTMRFAESCFFRPTELPHVQPRAIQPDPHNYSRANLNGVSSVIIRPCQRNSDQRAQSPLTWRGPTG